MNDVAPQNDAPEPEPLVVLRCLECGSTFTSHGGGQCPTCGAEDTHPAEEPLL